MRNVRRHFLHQVSNDLVKTHDRLVLEDLNVVDAQLPLQRALSQMLAGSDFVRLVRYKQAA